VTETSVDETRPWGGVADRRTGNWAARGPGAGSKTCDMISNNVSFNKKQLAFRRC
jgi:hypothetical protein